MNERMKIVLKHYRRESLPGIPGSSTEVYYVPLHPDSPRRMAAELGQLERRNAFSVLRIILAPFLFSMR